jgi:hypothetical protein
MAISQPVMAQYGEKRGNGENTGGEMKWLSAYQLSNEKLASENQSAEESD